MASSRYDYWLALLADVLRYPDRKVNVSKNSLSLILANGRFPDACGWNALHLDTTSEFAYSLVLHSSKVVLSDDGRGFLRAPVMVPQVDIGVCQRASAPIWYPREIARA